MPNADIIVPEYMGKGYSAHYAMSTEYSRF